MQESHSAVLPYDESTLRKCLAEMRVLNDGNQTDEDADGCWALSICVRDREDREDYIDRATALFVQATCDSVWRERVMSWDGETILGLHTLSHADFIELQSFLGSWMLVTAEDEESMVTMRENPENAVGRNWLFQTIYDNTDLEPDVFRRWVRAWVLIKPLEVNLTQNLSGSCLYFPLQLAVGYGDISGVEILLQAGARVNTHDDEGKTALHFVERSVSQRAEKVMLLVTYGADVTLVDMSLRSALHSAVRIADHIVVTALLAATDKATRQQQHAACDINFQTPFITACKLPPGRNADHIIKLLLADGCDPDTQPPALHEPGMGKMIVCRGILSVAIRWGGTAATIKLPLCKLANFVCKETSVIPTDYLHDWEAFFRRFLEENNGAVFKTATRVNEFDIWFKRTDYGTWPVLFQAGGPFKLSFRIPAPSHLMQFHMNRNRGFTAAHSIVYDSSQRHQASPCVVGQAFRRLQFLDGLYNPLVTSYSGKTVADMFAEHIKTVGAEWLVNDALSTPRLHTTNPNRVPMVRYANLLLQEAEKARDVIALSQHTRVGANSGLLRIGSEMLQLVFEVGHLGHMVN